MWLMCVSLFWIFDSLQQSISAINVISKMNRSCM